MLAALFICIAPARAQDRLAEQLRGCAGCHGADGNSAVPGTPSLAAQPRIFLENYLVLSREGIRGPQVMQALLKGVPDKELVALARHYSELKAGAAADSVDKKLFQKGRAIATRNHCANCHEKSFRGREQMPRLAGQREDFLAETMLAYRQNRRPGGDTQMAAQLYGIPEADFKSLAHYFSHLK